MLEGVGYFKIPGTMDRRLVDHWIKVDDKPSFLNARKLISSEGLLIGGTSGTALTAAY